MEAGERWVVGEKRQLLPRKGRNRLNFALLHSNTTLLYQCKIQLLVEIQFTITGKNSAQIQEKIQLHLLYSDTTVLCPPQSTLDSGCALYSLIRHYS